MKKRKYQRQLTAGRLTSLGMLSDSGTVSGYVGIY
jgi:hypothetical protein